MNQGLPRRLHSLSGVVPLGAYVLIHIWVTASIGSSLALYDRQVGFLHGGVLLGLLEIVLVLVPLAYHAVYGIIRSLQPREVEPGSHGYDNDLMLTLQRASGMAVLVFTVLHVWEFRGQTWGGGLPVGSYSTKLVADLSSTTWGIPWIALGYLAGIAATLFHLVAGMTVGRRDGHAYLDAMEHEYGVVGRLLAHGVLDKRIPPLWESRPRHSLLPHLRSAGSAARDRRALLLDARAQPWRSLW